MHPFFVPHPHLGRLCAAVLLFLGLWPQSTWAGPPLSDDEAEEVVALAIPEGPELPDSVQSQYSVRSELVVDSVLAPGSGGGMLLAGATLSTLGFAGQLIGLRVVHDRCDGFSETSPEAVDFSSVQACGVGYQGGVAIVLTSAVTQLAAAPWAIAGGVRRGRYLAFQDYLVERRSNPRPTRPWVWGGVGALAAGTASWIVSPIVAVERCKNSTSLTCSVDGTTWGYSVGLGLLTAGGAMLGRGLAYRNRYRRYAERVEIQIRPQLSRTTGGVMLSGRF